MSVQTVLDCLRSSTDRANTFSKEHPIYVLGGVAVTVSAALFVAKYLSLNTTSDGRKNSLGLSLGYVKGKEGEKKWENYASSWDNGNAQAKGAVGSGVMSDLEKTSSVVNDFYSFVTDIYEWGWGASFHFSPKLWSHDWKAGEAAQEVRIAHMLRAAPGQKILDVGCGVGGPMRIIAASTGAHITGITISDYQVERCRELNKKAGLQDITDVVQGDFHKMPFPDNSFDHVFTVEATCHASEEWVSTKAFDKDNKEHVRIIEEINFGNSLPNMRTWEQAEDTGKEVGFNLVCSYDAATIAVGPNRPWFERLTQFRHLHYVDDAIVKTLSYFGLLPKAMRDVHTMLVNVAKSLVQGGESGVFTPMYMICFEKPKK